MSGIVVLLLQFSALDGLTPDKALGKTGGMLVRDILLIAGALLVLAVILVIWARSASRRSKRRRRHHRRSEPGSTLPKETASGSREHRHHRNRRQRRDHRGRNPTLDEAGGLPPMRSESSSTPPL